MRDIGTMAECHFGSWCSSMGVTANSSNIDRTGWDYFVEFPLIFNGSVPRDLLPPPIECKVQVKATDSRDRKENITLSNMLRLIKSPIPAFFCLIEYDGKNEPQSVFLVHVGKAIIEKTLKRIRKLGADKRDNKLNKRTITLTFSDEGRLQIPFEESLKKAIESQIINGMNHYMDNKIRLLNTLGFESGSYIVRFNVSGDNPIEDMIDATLGMRNEIKVEKFTGHHSRFGIVSKIPVISAEGGTISFPDIKPVSKAKIRFKEYKFSPSISFDADAYFSPLSKYFPDHMKLRLESELFQIVVEPFKNTAKYSFSLNGPERHSLRKFRDILKVLTIFRKSPNGMVLEIEPEAFVPLTAKISVNETIDDYSEAYEIVEMALSICNKFGISDDEILIKMDDLRDASGRIMDFYKVTHTDPKRQKVSFFIEDEKLEGEKICCMFHFSSQIGDHYIRSMIGLKGKPNRVSEKQYVLIPDEVIIESPMIMKEFEKNEISLNEAYEKFATKLESGGIKAIRMTFMKDQENKDEHQPT